MEKKIIKGRYTVDGAGVKLFRVFANQTTESTDPFLLLDNFGSDRKEEYIKGFPWHPHRGIETVTYMFNGVVEHGDSIGNTGKIDKGDVQWMTAGCGVLHQEMPQETPGFLSGVQLWVNLPAKKKMMEPRYRGITCAQVPVVEKNGATVRVIAGKYGGTKGPVTDLVVDVEYFDVTLAKGKHFEYQPKKGYTTFCFVASGSGVFEGDALKERELLLLRDAPRVSVEAKEGLRFMLGSGKPLKEPIAWGGPIVMNTASELEAAFQELENGTFIKEKKKA